MGEHAAAVSQHERRVVQERRRHVPHLHPALGPPPHEFDLLGVEMRAARDGRGAVVLFQPPVHNQIFLLEIRRHRRAGIWRRVLDIRPVDVASGEREVCGNRLAPIVWIAHDEASNDEHAMTMQMIDRRRSRIGSCALAVSAVLCARLQEREILVQDVLDAEKDVSESGLLHQRRKRLAVRGNRGSHCLHEVVDPVQSGGNDRATELLEPIRVERDVVVDEKDRARASRVGVRNVIDHPLD